MKIAYISDQFIPSPTADTEQFVNMTSALSKFTSIELVSAGYYLKTPPTLDQINSYYFTKGAFSLKFVRHVLPNIRGFEKVFFAIRSALQVNKDKEIKLVYTRNIPIVMATLLFTNKPILFETYRPWPDRNIFARWFFLRMAKTTQFSGVVLHSEFAKRSFLQAGFKNEQLTVEHNAIEGQLFDGVLKEGKQYREELGLPKDMPIVAYTGTVNAQKGLCHYLTLAKAFPEVCFLLVGSEGQGEIEKKATLIENVKVIPRQDKQTVVKYISASDILYIPTSLRAREQAKNTVLPLKTFIYKKGGKAILAPDIEDIREVLKDGETAILVSPDDDVSAIKGLKRLLEDEDLRNKLGSNAQAEMESMTWEQRALNVLEFIKQRIQKND